MVISYVEEETRFGSVAFGQSAKRRGVGGLVQVAERSEGLSVMEKGYRVRLSRLGKRCRFV